MVLVKDITLGIAQRLYSYPVGGPTGPGTPIKYRASTLVKFAVDTAKLAGRVVTDFSGSSTYLYGDCVRSGINKLVYRLLATSYTSATDPQAASAGVWELISVKGYTYLFIMQKTSDTPLVAEPLSDSTFIRIAQPYDFQIYKPTLFDTSYVIYSDSGTHYMVNYDSSDLLEVKVTPTPPPADPHPFPYYNDSLVGSTYSQYFDESTWDGTAPDPNYSDSDGTPTLRYFASNALIQDFDSLYDATTSAADLLTSLENFKIRFNEYAGLNFSTMFDTTTYGDGTQTVVYSQ